jgi:hypothetical protein
MTTPHKATPEQWARLEMRQLGGNDLVCAALELRDRIAALEAAANPSAGLTGSPAPGDGLVEQVVDAIHDEAGSCHAFAEARAAIHAVAEWFDAIGYGATASILRQELQRHG